MRAIVLAAGRGERLLPLTATVPKPAVPVLGRTMIGHVLRSLCAQGYVSIVMNAHHLADRLAEAVGDGSEYGLEELRIVVEGEEILGTGGGVRNAARLLDGGEPIVVRNSDFLADIDLAAVHSFHEKSGCPATLVVVPQKPGYTPVDLDDSGRIVAIGAPASIPAGPGIRRTTFTGCQIVEPRILERLPPQGPSDIVRDLYLGLVARGELAGYVHDGLWWEFGNPSDYLNGSLALIDMPPEQRHRLLEGDPVIDRGEARVAMGAGADCHAGGISLRGRLALGFASRIGEGASLEDTIVMPEAWVGPGARLERAVIATGVEVPAGVSIEGSLVCAGSGAADPLPPGTIREGSLLIRRL